jgi:hypothetical protein
MTDGLLVLRYLFDFRGKSMVNGVLGTDATRTDPTVIAAYLDGLCTSSAKSNGAKSAAAALAASTNNEMYTTRPLQLQRTRHVRAVDAVFRAFD